MKKILTIAATGVICVLAGATQTLAQAAPAITVPNVTGGTAGSTCVVTGNTPGTLGLSADGTQLSSEDGGTKGTVTVKCAQGTSLKVGTPVLTATPPNPNPTTANSKFTSNSGGFVGVAANFAGTSIAPVKTNRNGATANISTTVKANGDEFITPGDYVVTVPVTLTP